MTAIDRPAVGAGTVAAVAIALPAALLGEVAVGDDQAGNLVFPLVAAVLAGFAAGGWVAARRAPGRPLTTAGLAALAAFALIQGAGLVRRLATDEPVSVPSIVLAGVLAYSAGLVGGLVAARRHRDAAGEDR